VLAIIKPVLRFDEQIERYSKLYSGHGDAFFDLGRIVRKAVMRRALLKEAEKSYFRTVERLKKLVPLDDPALSKKLLRDCFEEVNREIPAEKLWMPAYRTD